MTQKKCWIQSSKARVGNAHALSEARQQTACWMSSGRLCLCSYFRVGQVCLCSYFRVGVSALNVKGGFVSTLSAANLSLLNLLVLFWLACSFRLNNIIFEGFFCMFWELNDWCLWNKTVILIPSVTFKKKKCRTWYLYTSTYDTFFYFITC